MRAIERMIARGVIEQMLTQFPYVVVDYDRGFEEARKIHLKEEIDEAMDDVFACDEVWLMADGNRKDGFGAFVYLIFGNGNSGLDVITDYSGQLDDLLKPVTTMIELLDEGKLELAVRS